MLTGKCHNHRPQTNSRHLEEETHNTDSHMTAGTHFSKVTTCLPRQDDFEKQVSMTCKCHIHRPQTNLRHLEEETHNTDSHMTARTHFSKVTTCLPRQDDFEKQVR